MKNFEDLENVEIEINYNLLDQSFWDVLSNSISINIILCSFVLRFWWYICFAAGF